MLWRIVPFLLLCYIVAYLDRVNVGIASLTMNRDLGLSPSAFGWSAGLFFFGYFLAEVPSNLALQAVGARKWIARILITWGLLSAGDGVRGRPGEFWRHALPARPRRGRLHARRVPLLHLLVPGTRPRPRDGGVSARHPDREHCWRAALKFIARALTAWPACMAGSGC